MSKEHTHKETVQFVRQELRKQIQMLHTELQDLDRRAIQGFPPKLTAVAVRALAMNIMRAQELAGELVGLDRSDDL